MLETTCSALCCLCARQIHTFGIIADEALGPVRACVTLYTSAIVADTALRTRAASHACVRARKARQLNDQEPLLPAEEAGLHTPFTKGQLWAVAQNGTVCQAVRLNQAESKLKLRQKLGMPAQIGTGIPFDTKHGTDDGVSTVHTFSRVPSREDERSRSTGPAAAHLLDSTRLSPC
eukprot:161542-Chlamydomonas_euryale.AAC.2